MSKGPDIGKATGTAKGPGIDMKDYSAAVVDLGKDAETITSLWRDGFRDRNVPAGKLHWYYRHNPEGAPLVVFLLHGSPKVPVGTATAARRRVRLGSERFTIGTLGDFVVLERHRTLFPAMFLQKEIQRLAMRDCEILWGTPNRKSEAVFRRIGYKRIGSYLRRARVLRSAGYLSRVLPSGLSRALGPVVDRARLLPAVLRKATHAGLRTEWLDQPDARFDDLWERVAAPGVLMGVRDRAFLAWRFGECPIYRTTFFTLASADGQRLVAYAACEAQGQALHVRDFLVDRSVPGIFARLWAELSLEAFRQGRASLSLTFLGDEKIQQALQAAGFVVREQQPAYAATAPGRAGLVDESHWYLTSADEDG